jgi:hypothetical protein
MEGRDGTSTPVGSTVGHEHEFEVAFTRVFDILVDGSGAAR